MRKVCNHPSLALTSPHPKYAEFGAAVSKVAPIHDLCHSSKLLALRQLLWDCGIGLLDQTDGGGGDANDADGQVGI